MLSQGMTTDTGNAIAGTIKEYGKRLFGFIRNKVRSEQDAEDILQDVWYQLSNVINIEEIDQMSGWLHQVARNKIIDKYRKKTPELLDDFTYENEEDSFSLSDILLADNYTPETEYIREVFWKELFLALEELPENQRQVFVWNELEDVTLQDIATNTNENLKTIISRKGYAVKHLRKRMKTVYDEFFN
ncbi:RNA polymerase subunit sigma-24 [Dyadobacter frigoris]|nr:RNA polymerase subunit sigma-24 [Dyadobacter frigoris]